MTHRCPRPGLRRFVVIAAVALALLPEGPVAADSQGWEQDGGGSARLGSRMFDLAEQTLPQGHVEWILPLSTLTTLDKFLALPMRDSSPVVAAGSGTIYVGTVGGLFLSDRIYRTQSLVAINPNGTKKWAVSLQAGGYTYKVRTAPAVRTDGSVAVVGYRKHALSDGKWQLKGRVFLVSSTSAILRTSDEFDGVGLSAPLVHGNDIYVFAHPVYTDDLLRKFDGTTFAESWIGGIHYDINGSCYCGYYPILFDKYSWGADPDTQELFPAPSLDWTNSEILQPSRRTARFRLTGGRIWQKDLTGWTTAVVVSGATSFLVGGDGLEALNRYGTKIWAVWAGSRGLAKGENQLYVSSRNYLNVSGSVYFPVYLYSYTTSGSLRWKLKLGEDGQVGAPVVARGPWGRETVIVVHENIVWGFDADGNPAFWPITLDSRAVGSPAIADGRIYIATEKSLYAIR